VLVVVCSALLWYMFAMTTVARSRFSTPTIGREHMIGRVGTAITDFSPLGEVEVDGARWSATAHREAGLSAGSAIQVVGVDGRFLEVEPTAATEGGESA
jgi:membrane-bound ClpP family serine protease